MIKPILNVSCKRVSSFFSKSRKLSYFFLSNTGRHTDTLVSKFCLAAPLPQCLLFRRFFSSVPSFVPCFALLGAIFVTIFWNKLEKNTQTPYRKPAFPATKFKKIMFCWVKRNLKSVIYDYFSGSLKARKPKGNRLNGLWVIRQAYHTAVLELFVKRVILTY